MEYRIHEAEETREKRTRWAKVSLYGTVNTIPWMGYEKPRAGVGKHPLGYCLFRSGAYPNRGPIRDTMVSRTTVREGTSSSASSPLTLRVKGGRARL
jgi:hypothetical protein